MYGFNGDGFLEYKFENKLSIQTQLGILQTGYQNSYRYYLSATIGQELVELESSYSGYDYQIRYTNLINSWFIPYTFGEKYSIKPLIGFFAGVNLANKSEAESYIYIALDDSELMNDPNYPQDTWKPMRKQTIQMVHSQNFNSGSPRILSWDTR